MSQAIAQAFAAARQAGRAAFIPFLSGGLPDMATTARLLTELDQAGADVIEVGIPFSDPMADGPVIQEASKRALDAGATPVGVLEMLAGLRGRIKAPLVVMTYYNPVLNLGLEAFAQRAVQAGVSGAIVPDLPPEEAAPWLKAARAAGLDTIFMAAPTTPPERLPRLLECCSGFLYYVSMTGVTGAGLNLAPEVLAGIRTARAAAGLPLAVGFGVAQPSQAAALAGVADGVIVGSALVKLVLEAASPELAVQAVGGLARELRAALG
ncbi:MAG: tryptophan synthase subunit alpha [Desulfarculus sp.]|nr:tryptophan synthase subunit alpha [Desulfarculus sp.]